MNKLQMFVCSVVMITSGYCMAAELTPKQQDLKENLLAAVGVFVCIQEGVEVVPLLDDDMQEMFDDYMHRAIDLNKKGVELPKKEWEEIFNYEKDLRKEIEHAKRD